jgi:hypothetical protein
VGGGGVEIVFQVVLKIPNKEMEYKGSVWLVAGSCCTARHYSQNFMNFAGGSLG